MHRRARELARGRCMERSGELAIADRSGACKQLTCILPPANTRHVEVTKLGLYAFHMCKCNVAKFPGQPIKTLCVAHSQSCFAFLAQPHRRLQCTCNAYHVKTRDVWVTKFDMHALHICNSSMAKFHDTPIRDDCAAHRSRWCPYGCSLPLAEPLKCISRQHAQCCGHQTSYAYSLYM